MTGAHLERAGPAVAPGAAGLAAGPSTASAVPHSMQNLAPGGFSAPQFGHRGASSAPHDMQNRARSGFSAAQFGQAGGRGIEKLQ